MKVKYFILIAVALLSVLSLSAFVNPGGVGAGDNTRTISVTGSGKAYLKPDMATINIGVHTENENVAQALSDNTKAAQSVADALASFGVDPKDIQTTNFSVYPNQQYGPMGEMMGVKYMVDNTVLITVRELDKLGDILSTVVSKGANNIYGITFDVADRSAALAEARNAAVTDARKQADALAAAAGVKVGQVMNLSVSNYSQPVPMYSGYGMGGGMDMAAPPISGGQLVVSVDAYVTYEMK